MNHIDYFEKLMVNIIHRKIRVNDGFGVSKVVTSIQDKKEDNEYGKPTKKFEDVKSQALLNENDSQTKKQFAEQLGVNNKVLQEVSATRDGKDSKDR